MLQSEFFDVSTNHALMNPQLASTHVDIDLVKYWPQKQLKVVQIDQNKKKPTEDDVPLLYHVHSR